MGARAAAESTVFSSCGRWLAVGLADGRLWLWRDSCHHGAEEDDEYDDDVDDEEGVKGDDDDGDARNYDALGGVRGGWQEGSAACAGKNKEKNRTAPGVRAVMKARLDVGMRLVGTVRIGTPSCIINLNRVVFFDFFL